MTQSGFDALLADADRANERRLLARDTAHLPGTMDGALPFFRDLIARHHAAMLAADVDAVMALRDEADKLALKLNDGEPGILADDDAPGCVLARLSAAAPGQVPLWGQDGDFIVCVKGMHVRIELRGVFGICSSFGFWPGFFAHIVAHYKPFLSETGYRSFLGIYTEPAVGLAPDSFCTMVVDQYVAKTLKGRLLTIGRPG